MLSLLHIFPRRELNRKELPTFLTALTSICYSVFYGRQRPAAVMRDHSTVISSGNTARLLSAKGLGVFQHFLNSSCTTAFVAELTIKIAGLLFGSARARLHVAASTQNYQENTQTDHKTMQRFSLMRPSSCSSLVSIPMNNACRAGLSRKTDTFRNTSEKRRRQGTQLHNKKMDGKLTLPGSSPKSAGSGRKLFADDKFSGGANEAECIGSEKGSSLTKNAGDQYATRSGEGHSWS